jgi:hypothetical protein
MLKCDLRATSELYRDVRVATKRAVILAALFVFMATLWLTANQHARRLRFKIVQPSFARNSEGDTKGYKAN